MARVALTDDNGALYGAPATWLNGQFSTNPEASARAVEDAAALMLGQVPPLHLTPPAVTVINDQGLDGVDAAAAVPDREPNASGWYTSVSPMNLDVQRYLGCGEPINESTVYPNQWAVKFEYITGQDLPEFTHEMRVTGGQVFQYMVRQQGGAFRLCIDGQYLTPSYVNIGGTAGDYAFITVDFGETLTRHATMRLEATTAIFFGVIHQTGATVSKVPGPDPRRVLFAGDSFMGGSGNVPGITALPKTAGWLLGYRDIVNSGVGGSGWIQPGNQGEPPLGDRLATDVVGLSPELVVISLGANDANHATTDIATAAETAVQAIRDGLPNAEIVVAGPILSTTSPGLYAPMQTAIFDAVSGIANVLTVDTTSNPWLTDANRNRYVGSDNVHPTQVGANYYGHRLAAGVALALGY